MTAERTQPSAKTDPVEERLDQQLIDAVVDYAIYRLDLEGYVVSWNTGAQALKGYTPAEIIGQHFSRFFTPPDLAAGKPAHALRVAAEAGRFEDEGWRVRKDGSHFWALAVLDAIRDETGKVVGFAKITRDMTERRLAQEQLDEAREQLFQSQKMEALGQLTGGLAHDFNNLLTVIVGGVDIVQRLSGGDERMGPVLENVRSAAQRGADLTRQLLAFARRQPLQLAAISIRERIEAAAILIRHSMKDGVRLEWSVDPEVGSLEADPSQLELALLNLALNGRDAMSEGGTIHIAAQIRMLTGEPGGLSGEHIAISVSDAGTGIPKDILDRVFEPFFTTKAFGQGTGLGLSQVYGFAKQSRGAVEIVSNPGEGTTVTLLLPSSAQASRAGAGEAAPRVLVVEDDPSVAMLAQMMLAEMGYGPVLASSASEALDLLKRDRTFGLVFSDIIMPGGMSGLEMAREVRRLLPELPIVLTTGFSAATGHNTEFPVVPKPYAFNDLNAVLNSFLPANGRGEAA